jgi:hypothetical protein
MATNSSREAATYLGAWLQDVAALQSYLWPQHLRGYMNQGC